MKSFRSIASRRFNARVDGLVLALALVIGGCSSAAIHPIGGTGGVGGAGGNGTGGEDPTGSGGSGSGGQTTDASDAPIDRGNPDAADAGHVDAGEDVRVDEGPPRPDAGIGGTPGIGGAPGTGGSTTDGGAPGTGGATTDGATSNDGGSDGGAVDAPTGIPPTAAGQLVISEVMIDTDAVTDDDAEWFEIYNPSTTVSYDLNGCTLGSVGATNVVSMSLVVLPGAYITLGRNQDPLKIGFDATYSYGATLKFSNSGGSVTVSCGPGGGTLIDSVVYGLSDVLKGKSHSLDPRHLDAAANDVTANWCLGTDVYRMLAGTNDYGTPNQPNRPCP